jgi:hypothetical protein
MRSDCNSKDWVNGKWSLNYQGLCCSTFGSGCNAIKTDVNDPVCIDNKCPEAQKCFDQDWVSAPWSLDFRAHCCRTQQRGCDAVRTQTNYPPLNAWSTPSPPLWGR